MREVVDAIGEAKRALGFEHQPGCGLLAHFLNEVLLSGHDRLVDGAPLRLRVRLHLVGLDLEAGLLQQRPMIGERRQVAGRRAVAVPVRERQAGPWLQDPGGPLERCELVRHGA